jgi:hypothetical protein
MYTIRNNSIESILGAHVNLNRAEEDMPFPNDIPDSQWNRDNLPLWNTPDVTNLNGIQLLPLEAKALHVIGTLVQIFNSVGYLLYCGNIQRPYADYYLYAYLLTCTAIELIGRCRTGETRLSRSTLESGFTDVGITTITVNINRKGVPSGYIYNVNQLMALRNLAAHGQGIASAGGRQDVLLHVELLDSFPGRLMGAYDRYYEDLFESSDPTARRMLAISAVEPVLYSNDSGQIYISPLQEAYKEIYQAGKKPSQVVEHTDWQVYNPERDKNI